MFLFFYYTDVYGISAAAAGTIMLAARVWDAVSDPQWLASLQTGQPPGTESSVPTCCGSPFPWGRAWSCCSPLRTFDQTGKIIFAACGYLMLSTFYTAVNLPFSALSGVMTSDSQERTLLNQYRFFLGFTGMFVVSLTMTIQELPDRRRGAGVMRAAMNLPAEALAFIRDFNWGEARLAGPERNPEAGDYPGRAGCLSADRHRAGGSGHSIAVLQLSSSTKERIEPPKDQVNNIVEDFKCVFGVRDWLILFMLGIVTFILINIQGAVVNQYFKYFVGRRK